MKQNSDKVARFSFTHACTCTYVHKKHNKQDQAFRFFSTFKIGLMQLYLIPHMHACRLVNSNLQGGITTVIEAILLVLQESVLLYKAVRFPVMIRIDWKQEQFPLWCCSEMVILGIEELGAVTIPTLVVI